jgi:uncharacterized repeat protein (TIGR01451 family)
MAQIRPFVRRRVIVAALLSFIFITALGAATVFAVCSTNSYVVTTSAPPLNDNWTDTTGALWSPPGGFPGCAAGDSASSTNVSPTTITINSSIFNGLASINFNAPGSVIQIDSGGLLMMDGPMSLTGGSKLVMNGGQLIIRSGGSFTANASNFQMNSGTLEVDTGGTFTVQSGQTVSIVGGTLDTAGALTIQPGGTLAIGSGAFFIINGGSITGDSSSGIQNSGQTTFNVSGAVTSSAYFNNQSASSTLEVQNGTFAITGGGTANGPITIDSGATLDFPAGSYTMGTGGTVSGAGTLSITGGAVSIGGVTSPANFILNAGTLTGAGFLSVSNGFTWSGGTMAGGGGAELAGTGVGVIDGAVGPMTLDTRTLNVYGTMTYSATTNPLTLQNGATLGVYGTFNITNDGSILDGGGSPLVKISPNGFFEKTGGGGTSTIHPQSQNDSTVFVASGTLEFAGNGSHAGGFFGDFGTTLLFSASSATFSSGIIQSSGDVTFPTGSFSTINESYIVDGTTTINGGTVAFNDNAVTQNFSMDSGALQTNAMFEIDAPGIWSGGTINGSGTFHVACCGAMLDIDTSTSDVHLNNAELWNLGEVDYTSSGAFDFHMQGATLTNDGTFDIQTDRHIVEDAVVIGFKHRARTSGLIIGPSAASISNTGTFKKSANSATSNIEPAFTNSGGTISANAGTMNFKTLTQDTNSNGTTSLNGGALSFVNPFVMNGGTLNGSGNITGDVNNAGGTLSPGTSPGTIAITGNYTQGSTGAMNIELAGTSAGQFDLVNVSGTVTLDGTLNVTLLSFTPVNGNTWQPLTFATRTGDFAVKNLPTFAGTHGSITASYTPASLMLTAVVTPQSSDLSIIVSAPLSVNAGSSLSYTVQIMNNGPDPTSGTTTVVNTLPAGATGASGSGTNWSCGAPSGGTITCTSTDVIASTGTFPNLTFTMTAPANSGTASDTATVSNANDSNGTNNSATGNTTVNAVTDLQVGKTGPGGVTSGQNIAFTIGVKNNGPSTATGVTLSDPTPANLTFVSASGGGCTVFPCSLGTLTAGQTVTVTATYSTSPNFSGNVTNIATVSGNESDPNNTNNSANATTNVGTQSDLTITKSGPASANTGQNITYTVAVKNNGPSDATNVVVNDATPTGLAFISNSGGCATAYPCNLGTVIAGQTVTINSTYNVPPNFTGIGVTNTASVTSSINDPNPNDNTASASTTVGQNTDLSISKSGPTTASPGQNIVYTITITNNGGVAAPNVTVTDATPAGTTFVSNSGACATPFPCNIGTLNPNTSATITSTFNVPANFTGTQVTNTASVSSGIGDPNNGNNSATSTTNIVPPSGNTPSADIKLTKSGPSQAFTGDFVNFTIDVLNNGPSDAANVVVTDPTPSGLTFVSNTGACTTAFPCNVGTVISGRVVRIVTRYSIQAASGSNVTNTASATTSTPDPNGGNNSGSSTVAIVTAPTTNQCPGLAPVPIAPAPGSTPSSPTTFSWTSALGATGYVLTVNGPAGAQNITTTLTSVTLSLPNGAYTWAVTASFGPNCPALGSGIVSFNICTPPAAPTASIVGESASGQTFTVLWTGVDGASGYELQESPDLTFANATTIPTSSTSASFTKVATAATPFFYRVRALACGQAGAYSPIVTIVVVPLPDPKDLRNVSVNAPAGSTQKITFPLFIPGVPGQFMTFIASSDKPWIAVTPGVGIVPPEGITITISVDPSGLVNGTWTGTVIVIFNTPSTSDSRAHTEVSQATSIPVSVSLVTPVTPSPFGAAAGSFVIPSAGHLAGASQWQSDVRIANVSPQSTKYMVTFNAGSGDPAAPVKQTTVTIDGGATMALDDVVRNWFGVGSLGDSANGMLFIQMLNNQGKPITDDTILKTTAVTSRTYNVGQTGTLGQFIPAIPFSGFIANSQSILSLQQISQSAAFHTNLGIAEAAGQTTNVSVKAFDGGGTQVLNLPLQIKPGQLLQLNSVLSQNGVSTLSNGRAEVSVTGGNGRVTAYASVVDSVSNDPFLVPPVTLGSVGVSRYVLQGIADLNTGNASWRSDVRVYNSSTSPQTVSLTFYPNGNPGGAVSKDASINGGEVKAFDNVLQSLFGLTNIGGTLHVTTTSTAPLVVTARTYDQTNAGTLGQFITAVTPNDAIGNGDRALSILQVEDSTRYRTNIGVAEITGKPVTVDVSLILPDSRVTPHVPITLQPFESRQISVSSFGVSPIYNIRVTLKVIDGAGKATGYGSVVDQSTQAPTFIPAQ